MAVKFDPTITLGSLGTAATVLVALGVQWGVFSSMLGVVKQDQAMQAHILSLHADSIRSLELSNRDTTTRLEYIAKGIDEIKHNTK